MFKNKGDSNIVYKCTVRLLEDTEILECEFHPSYKGKYLLEYVCQQLNIIETDYFGLRFVDSSGQRHWLHVAKSILKQVKECSPILFNFRVKFYPPNPLILKEDFTRFQIYLQLKRDLLHGRLYCSSHDAAMLGALIIQAELGDYDPSIHRVNYVSEMKLLLRQTESIESKILDLHREPSENPDCIIGVGGMSQQECIVAFLKITCQLETYGIDMHPVKDQRGNQLYLGFNHNGIQTFQAGKKVHHFKWNEVHKINFEGRMFIVHINHPEKKQTVGFKCPSGAACRHVWCCAIEQMLFFTLPSSADASVYTGGGLFSSTKFKYAGRTEREILQPDTSRHAASVPATPSTPLTNEFNNCYSSLPRSTHSAPVDESCDGACLLSGPTVDIALADHGLHSLNESHQPSETEPMAECSAVTEHSSSESVTTDLRCDEDWIRPPTPAVSHSHNHTGVIHHHRFSLLRALIPSFLFVCLTLALTTVVILETDIAPPIKSRPEMLSLHYHYYAPLKAYIRRTVIELF